MTSLLLQTQMWNTFYNNTNTSYQVLSFFPTTRITEHQAVRTSEKSINPSFIFTCMDIFTKTHLLYSMIDVKS